MLLLLVVVEVVVAVIQDQEVMVVILVAPMCNLFLMSVDQEQIIGTVLWQKVDLVTMVVRVPLIHSGL